MGSSWLTASRLENYAAALTTWGDSLSDGADILFYGCDLAGSAEGRTLLSLLSLLTGADIAASIDDTGHAELGGDWNLEFSIGGIESQIAISAVGQSQWQGLLQNVVFQQGTNSYAGTQDTHIEESAGGRVNGANSKVWVHDSPLSIGLLRFDDIFGDGPGQIPLGSTIHSATVSIDVANAGNAGSTLALHQMLIDWSQGDSWDTGAWSINGAGLQFDDIEASTNIDAFVSTAAATGVQTFSGAAMTETVQQWANGAANFGWAVNYSGSGAMAFNSSEAGGAVVRPMLTIDYTAPPVVLKTTAEQRVNVTTTNPQVTSNANRGSHDAVTILPNGDSIFVWSSQNQDGSGWGVYTQRYNSKGLAITAESLVNLTTTGDQRYASIASDANGNFAVTWTSSGQDGAGQGVYARVYYNDGTSSNEFRVNQTTAGEQFNSAIDMDDVGHIIVVWEGNGTQSGQVDTYGAFLRRFNLDTTAIGGEVRVNTVTANGQNQVSVAATPDGRFVVTWDDDIGVLGRRFAANGTARDATQFIVQAEPTAGEADVAIDDNGNFTVVWRTTDQGDGSQRAVLMSRFADNGTVLQGPTVVSDVSANLQTNPSIAMLATGESIVVWEGAGPGDTDGVFARKFAADGTPLSGEFRVNSTVSGSQSMASVAMVDINNFTVAWSGNGTGDTSGVFLKQFGTMGIPAASLILSTNGNVTSSGVPGLDSWTTGTILRLGDPGFQLGSSTTGVLQQFGSGDNIPVDGSINIDAFHFVTTQITLANGTVLLPGDVLYSANDLEIYPSTPTNVAVPQQTILRFRPLAAGDYSVGNIGVVYVNLGSGANPLLTGLSDINGISLIERDVVVAGTTLVAGDMLFTRSTDAGGFGNDIFVYHAAIDTASRLVEGTDIGITGGIGDIELIESTIVFGGQTLNSGTILLTLVADEAAIGSTGLSSTANDVIGLQLSQNSMTGSSTVAIANLVLDGSDIGLDSSAEQLNALSIVSLNAGPVAVNDAYTVTAGTDFDSEKDAWYDSDWDVRQKISFDNSTRSENLANFPVLISLDATRIDYSRVHGAGDDLRFVDRDGTELAYEIESWNPNGRSTVWVKVPQIDANSASDFIWMYYDNDAGVAAGENGAAVWSNSFDAVYHFSDAVGPGGVITDSTGRGIDGTNVGTTAASGVVGGARSFNGVDQYIDLGDNLTLIQGASGVTLSAWVQTSTTNNDQRIIGISKNGPPSTADSRASMQIDGTEVRSFSRANDTETHTITTTTGAGVAALEWKQVSLVINYANDTVATYVNGTLISTSNVNFVGTASAMTAVANAALGAEDNGTLPTFGGLMDEVRIASAARSAAWLNAEYAASADTLARYGAIQTVAGVLENDIDPEGFSLTATGLDVTGTQGTVVLNADGSFTYADNGLFGAMIAGESATTQFRYTAIDSEGASSTALVTLTIQGVNDAPELDSGATMTLNSVLESDTNPAGNTVADILGSAGDPITDVDAGAVEGMAVYQVNNVGGLWEYTTNGTTWTAFGTVTESSAVLLNPTARVRFVPDGSHAAHNSSFLFRAWDRTDGNLNGATGVDIRTNGDHTAFSEEVGTASIVITQIDHEPVAVADTYSVAEDSTLNTHPGDWFDVNWQARRRLTFDNAAATESLIDFPVLVKLDATRIDYAIMKGDGTDLRFVDALGNVLAYEIDEWNPSGVSSVWVKVPAIAAGSTENFVWMYYGNNIAANGENAAAVWSNGYEAVYHLEEDPISSGGRFGDSTGRLPDATNDNTANAAGQIGQGQQFNTGTAIDLGDNLPLLQGTPAATLSAWIKPDTVAGNSVILGIADNVFLVPDLSKASIEIVDGKLQIVGMDSNDSVLSFALVQTSGAVVTVGEWQLVTAVVDYSSGTIDVYVNGQSVGHFDNRFDRPTSDATIVNRAAIGAEDGGSGSHFDGLIDEVQVSGVARSASWVAAQYASMANEFVSFSGELNQAGVLDNDTDPEGDTLGAFIGTGPTHAQNFTFNGSGSFTYTPVANFVGVDTFTYYVSDGTQNSTPVTVTINVTNVNDAPTTTGIANITVNEDAPNSSVNLWAALADDDNLDSQLTFTVTNNTNPALFTSVTPNNVTGTLTLNYAANQFGSSNITIRATDPAGLFVETTFNITVNSVNDIPTTTGIANVTVNEDAADSLVNLWNSFADIEDADAQLVFTVVANTNAALFTSVTPNDTTGLLRLNYAPNQFGTSQITVRVTDRNGGQVESTLTVTVNAVNDPPTTSGISGVTVNEDAPNSSVNLWAAFADVDDLDSQLTFTVTNNTNSALFTSVTPNNVTGTLTLDYAANQFGSSNITIRATDTGGKFVETTFNVTVNPVNDAPAISTIPNQTVLEDGTTGPLGFTIGDVDNVSSALTVTATSNNGTLIPPSSILLGGTGSNRTVTITPAANLSGGPVTIRVTVTDGSLEAFSEFQVTVTPVNDPLTIDANTSISVDKGSSVLIGSANLHASDIDTLPIDRVYTVTSNTGGGHLGYVSAQGTPITTFTQLDIDNGQLKYVHTGGTSSNVAIGLSVTDGTTSLTLSLSITVDNQLPIAQPGGPYTVVEGGQLTLDGSASADADGTIVSYEWDFDYDGLTFHVDATGATPILDATALNGPTLRTIALRVVDESGASSSVVTTSLTVLNVAPNAVDDNGIGFITNEDAVFTTASVLANDTDPAGGDVLSVLSFDTTGTIGTVTNNGDGTFTYNPNGQFESLAVGQTATDQFTYTVQDGDGWTSVATVTIVIEGRNDRPTLAPATFTIAELAPLGTIVGTIVGHDVDAGDTLTYSIVSGNTSGAFAFNGSTGTLTVADPTLLDHETTSQFGLVVQVRDAAGLTRNANITINLADTKEAPVLDDVTFVLSEDAPNGHLVGTLIGLDADAGDGLTYTILGGDGSDLFALNATTGELRVLDRSTFDFESQSQWSLLVEVRDTAGLTDTATITIQLTDANDAPTVTPIGDLQVVEDAPAIVIDLAAAFVDPDTGDLAGLTFTVTESSLPGLLASTTVNPTAATLTLNLKANANGQSNITIRATDAGGLFASTTFLLTVTAANDTPIIRNDSYTASDTGLVESTLPGVLFGANDIDGDTLSAVLVSGPSHGTVILNADGSFTYQADKGFVGQDRFRFVASDGTTTSSEGVITISVIEVVGGALPPTSTSNGSSTSNSSSGTEDVESGTGASTSGSTTAPGGVDIAGGNSGNSGVANLPTENDEDDLSGFALQNQDDEDDLLGLLTRRQQEEIFSNRQTIELQTSGQRQSSEGRHAGDIASIGTSTTLGSSPLWMNDYRAALQFVGQPGKLWDDLDSFQKQVNATFGTETVVIGSAATAAGSMTVGYVLWTLRSGVLLSSLLAQMPAWRLMDPLTILENMNLNDDEDDESLESFVDQEEPDPAIEPEPRSDK